MGSSEINNIRLSGDGARCTLFLDGPLWNGKPTATIGEWECTSTEAGTALLQRACSDLRAHGAEAVLAPMNGDTWHSYRTVLESDGSPAFALEPVSGPYDLLSLQGAGFDLLEQYCSARAPVPQMGSVRPDLPGIRITPWDGQGASHLVGHLHAYAAGSFADKLFFKPLDEGAFRVLYEPLLAMLDPRLVLFAHDDAGQLMGFLFGYPDLAQGAQPTQVILKTYASTKSGVGFLLAWHFHEIARDLGYRHIVHALMHMENISLKSSRLFNGIVFRRYGIMGKLLHS